MAKKEVDFRVYCPKCKDYTLPEDQDPCNICLGYGSNEDSHKPVFYREKERYGSNRNKK